MEAARAAAADWRGLVRLSRPRTWAIAAAPFIVAAIDAERAVTPVVVLGLLFFLGPFQLLHHGLAEIHATAADPERPAAMATRVAIAAVCLPLLTIVILAGGPAAGVVLLALVALAAADVSPPAHLRTRPGADLLVAALLAMLPAVTGALLGGRTFEALPWPALLALGAWGIGTAALLAVRASVDEPGAAAPLVPPATGTIGAIGPLRTTMVAALAYALAAVLAATLGFLGLLAGLGLALFLLPPAMILAAGSDRPLRGVAPEPGTAAHALGSTLADVAALARSTGRLRVAAAARHAWSEMTGLVLLVGAWLGILLLQDWSVTTYTPWMVAIVVPTALAAYAVANTVAIRIATRRRRITAALHRPGAPVPPLTIIVPTRDDVATLPANLAALRSQTYPDTTVLVVDDASADGSRDEAAAWIGADAVISAPPRPDGWSSHAWACHVGAGAAATELLLFVESDTVLAPIGARVLVEQLMERGDDLLVGLTRDAMPTVAERAAVPGFALVRDGFAPTWWAAVTGGRPAWLVVPDGPLMLARRDAYLATDGHRPVSAGPTSRGLTHAFARAGRRVGVVRMARLAATRRYRDVDGVIAGWRGRIIADGRGRLAGAIGVLLLSATAFLAPLVLPAVAILAREDRDVVVAACIPLAVLVAMRALLAIVERQPPTAILWHPVTILITLIGQVLGLVDHVLGRETPTGEPAPAVGRPAEGPTGQWS
jgi:hypothetical protein